MNHKPFFIMSILVMLMVASLYSYMYYSVGSMTEQAVSARKEAIVQKVNNEHIDELVNDYKSTVSDWTKVPGFFVQSDDVVSFIKAIESLGSGTGAEVTLPTIDADNMDSASPGKIGAVRAHVEAQGSWSAVMRVLMLSEDLPYNISVDHILVNVSPVQEGKYTRNIWKIAFDIKADMISGKSSSN